MMRTKTSGASKVVVPEAEAFAPGERDPRFVPATNPAEQTEAPAAQRSEAGEKHGTVEAAPGPAAQRSEAGEKDGTVEAVPGLAAQSPQTRHYAYFQNTACEYFPCHKGAREEDFNCLFCYCPLYALGPKCGGNFRYLENGVKDCSGCLFPHKRANYGAVTARFEELVALTRRGDGPL